MNIILYFLAIVSLLILIWQISNLVSAFFGSPYIKSNREIIIKSLKLVRLKKGEVFYDLGCGNADVLIVAQKYGAQAIGFEISPFYYLWAKLRTWRFRNINVRYRNIKDVDLGRADVVYCYLLPALLEKLSSKFEKELKSGSRLISIGFPIADLQNEFPYSLHGRKIFIYKI